MRRPALVAPALLTAIVVTAATAGPASVAVPAATAGPEPATGPPASNPVPGPAEAGRAAAGDAQEFPSVPYDGTYTFVRVRFNTVRVSFGGGFGPGRGPP